MIHVNTTCLSSYDKTCHPCHPLRYRLPVAISQVYVFRKLMVQVAAGQD